MERENSVKNFDQQCGMKWNLKNWPFDIIDILYLHLGKIKEIKFVCIFKINLENHISTI